MKLFPKLTGIVVGIGAQRTAAVEVSRMMLHPRYLKYVKLRKKYLCHDRHSVCRMGDRVEIKFVGRISKKKKYSVIDMLRRQPQPGGEPCPQSKLVNSPYDF